jgi:hypothetical protein
MLPNADGHAARLEDVGDGALAFRDGVDLRGVSIRSFDAVKQ